MLGENGRWGRLCAAGLWCVLWGLLAVPVSAEVTVSGDVLPNIDPTTWDGTTYITVGSTGSGELGITDGSVVNHTYGHIGFLAGSTGTVVVDGAGSAWLNKGILYIGSYGNGALNITNGGYVSNASLGGRIGVYLGSSGVVTVDGIGSIWSSNSISVGGAGNGKLNIINGGLVEVSGGTNIGSGGGQGEIHFDGGTLNTGSFVVGQDQVTGVGTVNTHGLIIDSDLVLDSAESLTQHVTWNRLPGQNITLNWDIGDQCSHLGAGYTGNGMLTINNGISVSSGYGYVGYKAGSTGKIVVDGAGSSWIIAKIFQVGRYGNGELTICNGAEVSGGNASIGAESGSSGVITVDGVGSKLLDTGSDYYVGESGSGLLNIINGACAELQGRVRVGDKGEIHFADGTLTAGAIYASRNQLTGTGTINTHGLISDVDLVFDDPQNLNQTLIYDGLPEQNLTIHLSVDGQHILGVGDTGEASLLIQGGTQVISSSATLGNREGSLGFATVTGAGSRWDTQSLYSFIVGKNGQGTLNITHGGLVRAYSLIIDSDEDGNSCIKMASGGTLIISGHAQKSIDEFLYRIGGTDDIRYWNGSAWANITAATAGVDYTLEYVAEGELAGYTALTVFPEGPETLPGDYNEDGSVDLADYTIWADHFGMTGENLPGDGNGDGVVDIADYTIWADNFGQVMN